jgi:hypothetical protein
VIDRVSVEPSRRCSKGCSFCYNGSNAEGEAGWTRDELVAFAVDCARNGVASISIGGGEPLEYPPLFDVLCALDGVIARTLTSNALVLDRDPAALDALVRARPDKVHVSIHAPENAREVERCAAVALALDARGVRAGINLLVRKSRLAEATSAFARLRALGFTPGHIVLLPARGDGGADTPSPDEVARVARADDARAPFQAMSCLTGCSKSARFASVASDKTAAWCSYTRARRPLRALSFAALAEALDGLALDPCDNGLVRTLVRG